MQKVLVIQTAFIGDVILATSLLEKLHNQFPNTMIDILVRQGNESLFNNHPYLNKVLIWNKKTNKYKNLLQILWQIRAAKYTQLINLQRYAATGFLTIFSGAKTTIGFNKNPFSFLFSKSIVHSFSNKEIVHEIDKNQQLIAHFTDNVSALPKLYPSKLDEDFIADYIKLPFVTMAPNSVWFTKQLPKQKWIELINKTEVKIFLLGAKSDKEYCQSIINQSTNKNVVNLSGTLSFLQSAAIMKFAKMNYVNDSAPMHLASSVNAAVTAIYCSTSPSFGYTPLSDISFVVESKQSLPCKPCGLHGKKKCPLNHFDCGNTIEVIDILKPN
jgi:heptosyltransferase II